MLRRQTERERPSLETARCSGGEAVEMRTGLRQETSARRVGGEGKGERRRRTGNEISVVKF